MLFISVTGVIKRRRCFIKRRRLASYEKYEILKASLIFFLLFVEETLDVSNARMTISQVQGGHLSSRSQLSSTGLLNLIPFSETNPSTSLFGIKITEHLLNFIKSVQLTF